MTQFYPRAGSAFDSRAGTLDTFRRDLEAVRERLRSGLAEAAAAAVASAVRRVARSLLGEHFDEPALPSYSRHEPTHDSRSWDRSAGRSDWDDGWSRRSDEWDTPDEDQELEEPPDPGKPRSGFWREAVAAACQAVAWWLRCLTDRWRILAAIGSALLSALTLLLGGQTLACEAGLSIADATGSLLSALTSAKKP
jgi:hypothetical protein